MGLKEIISGKKEWYAHQARVKKLPEDYRLVYKEIQNYIFMVGPVDTADGLGLLTGIVDLFEEGAAHGKGVLEVTGSDVAAFCDELIKGSKTYDDIYQESVDQKVAKSLKNTLDKSKK
jgi:DNA-binding ferritin-like protein (Dps family)